jgi:hypothetical protein
MNGCSSVVADDTGGLLAQRRRNVAGGVAMLCCNDHRHVIHTPGVNSSLETFGIVSAAITPQELCNTAPATGDTKHVDRRYAPFRGGSFRDEQEVSRMEKRADPWSDFLRRLLLSASLAGTALSATAAAEEPDQPAAEIAEAEQPMPQLAGLEARQPG